MSFLNKRKVRIKKKVRSLSEQLLTTSSIISLIAAQQRIIDNGTAVVYLPVGDTPGIC